MLRPRLEALATCTGQLSTAHIALIGATLDRLEALDARQAALAGAVGILRAQGYRSRNALAVRLEWLLNRFDGQPRKNVQSGHRLATDLELCLLKLLPPPRPPGPIRWRRSARRIDDDLKYLLGL